MKQGKEDIINRFYNQLPFLIKNACTEMGKTPEELGIDLSKMGKGYETCWDLNPKHRHDWLKMRVIVNCKKCGNSVDGNVIVERRSLKIIDSSGFVIFADPICENCLDEK